MDKLILSSPSLFSEDALNRMSSAILFLGHVKRITLRFENGTVSMEGKEIE
jgi:hypothetical protein